MGIEVPFKVTLISAFTGVFPGYMMLLKHVLSFILLRAGDIQKKSLQSAIRGFPTGYDSESRKWCQHTLKRAFAQRGNVIHLIP